MKFRAINVCGAPSTQRCGDGRLYQARLRRAHQLARIASHFGLPAMEMRTYQGAQLPLFAFDGFPGLSTQSDAGENFVTPPSTDPSPNKFTHVGPQHSWSMGIRAY